MSTKMSTFPEKILRLRQKGYKVNEITEKLGVSRPFLQRLVKGNTHVPVDKQAIIDNWLSEVDKEGDTLCQPSDGLAEVVETLRGVTTRLDRLESILLDVLAALSRR